MSLGAIHRICVAALFQGRLVPNEASAPIDSVSAYWTLVPVYCQCNIEDSRHNDHKKEEYSQPPPKAVFEDSFITTLPAAEKIGMAPPPLQLQGPICRIGFR